MKYKLDDKVKIISKSYFGKLCDSYVYKKGIKKGIWYVCTVERAISDGKNITRYAVTYDANWRKSKSGGDYFLEQDLLALDMFTLEDELFEI